MKLLTQQDIPELKQFAATMMWAFPAVFMGLMPWLFSMSVPWWPAMVTVTLAILYGLYPRGIYYPYRLWMAIALVLGWVNTRIILGLAFYALIFPIGLLMRSIGKLQYRPKGIKHGSQWIRRDEKLEKQHLENPF